MSSLYSRVCPSFVKRELFLRVASPISILCPTEVSCLRPSIPSPSVSVLTPGSSPCSAPGPLSTWYGQKGPGTDVRIFVSFLSSLCPMSENKVFF
jgi:hypothetical protein